jgi:hypothetical protein
MKKANFTLTVDGTSVSVEYQGSYYGYTWTDEVGKEHYEEVSSSRPDEEILDMIKSEVRYSNSGKQKRQQLKNKTKDLIARDRANESISEGKKDDMTVSIYVEALGQLIQEGIDRSEFGAHRDMERGSRDNQSGRGLGGDTKVRIKDKRTGATKGIYKTREDARAALEDHPEKRSLYIESINEGDEDFLDSEYDMDDDDNEQSEVNEFWVAIIPEYPSEDSQPFVGKVIAGDRGWEETTRGSTGTPPHKWGGKYMSYLSPEEVVNWIEKDYRGDIVNGPYYSEQEALDFLDSNA